MNYRTILAWSIARRWLELAALVALVIWLGGCAANRLDREASPADRAACEAAVGAYKEGAWLIAYRDCLIAKGYK